ncbi:hypothetical protein TBLA_0B08340 [Henningerozyma blattae CBS 6284]|uniref:Uncharacterized protein n=1 Tax=Henningerozyma blattae (strain ATCC 34711 / CBS 6284 / DSM 70876 / NBRC 10599 / NRRL Y-10934 / UCD 77-7) TaxID=1071380 RepID=I2GZU7_HENB6|nr:hypothetical protein TBLA_0B08340 [Tetrapisispora blattae CBS 6284]CCH59649.1 hypothetical protein TBLA_0B08340 [Tetrapisispora blattae CBS 6284]
MMLDDKLVSHDLLNELQEGVDKEVIVSEDGCIPSDINPQLIDTLNLDEILKQPNAHDFSMSDSNMNDSSIENNLDVNIKDKNDNINNSQNESINPINSDTEIDSDTAIDSDTNINDTEDRINIIENGNENKPDIEVNDQSLTTDNNTNTSSDNIETVSNLSKGDKNYNLAIDDVNSNELTKKDSQLISEVKKTTR